MQRRRALQILSALVTVPVVRHLAGYSTSELHALGSRVHASLANEPPGSALRVLTAAQYRSVTTAAEHILPRTDTPGATDARVADFIDVMLADWHSPDERARFIAGLARLDADAMRAHRRAFAECREDQRLGLLVALDSELASLTRTDARAAGERWFGTLKYLTVWGYYTSRVGMTQELEVQFMPGRYDGDAPYRAR
jgi:hypothetical protein